MRPLVLYHANCMDGFCSAWVAHRKFGGGADYLPVQYGQEPPDVSGRAVYVIDFSYKRPVMRQILSLAHKVVVLDHHKTAETELAGIVDEFVQRPDLIANPPGSELPVIHFDMGKSGGRLAWEYFFPGESAPWLVDYTEDRDLWRWKLPVSQEINAALASLPRDFVAWDLLHAADRRDLLAVEGAAILRYQRQIVDSICQAARETEIDGHKVKAVNTSVLFSEVAGKLAEGNPFGAAWFVRSDGKKQWSLRSRDGGVDVSEVAKRRGGGGHRNAAGFEEVMA
jgi:oligoribonuclease NrnB/cAMP/cGMP phosphodiesterase (DHH superfamily)